MSTPHRGPEGPRNLGKLEEAYELQSELRHGRASTTFAARHREHGRDVTLTVLEASTPAERNALTHLAADARMLTSLRHPHVVPIVEARWLAANRLAVARARIRGSTLRQTLDAVGPMAPDRVIEVLRDVADVLQWASRSGVVHRHVESDCVCFQQGSSKVMVSFGLPASLDGDDRRGADDTAFLFERCADGMTLARLGYEMLTAHQAADASAESLRAVRPEAPQGLVAAIESGLRCGTDGRGPDAAQFMALADGGAPATGAGAIATASSAPVVPRGATVPVPPPAMPLATPPAVAAATVTAAPAAGRDASMHPRVPRTLPPPSVTNSAPAYASGRRRGGRGLFLVGILGLILLIGGTFYLIARDRAGSPVTRVATADRASEETGDVDVATPTLPPDPGGLTRDGSPAGPPPGAEMVPEAPIPEPAPGTEPGFTPGFPPGATPGAATTEPARSADSPPVVTERAPAPPPDARQPAVTSVVPRDACDSPSDADQRQCLTDRIEANDRELTSVYQALIRAVEERSGGDAVEGLRARQRDWIDRRDRECRRVGRGDLWARARAACFARVSDARALELARELARVRSGLR